MTKTVLIMRHGQASNTGNEDRLRPLTATGRHAVAAMGHAILDRGAVPDTIVTSIALRARETAREVAGVWNHPHPIVQIPELYSGLGHDYLKCLQALPDTTDSVLVVGHNPSIADLATRLRSSGAKMGPFEAGSIGCQTFAIDRWENLDWGSGHGSWFLSPTDILT